MVIAYVARCTADGQTLCSLAIARAVASSSGTVKEAAKEPLSPVRRLA